MGHWIAFFWYLEMFFCFMNYKTQHSQLAKKWKIRKEGTIWTLKICVLLVLLTMIVKSLWISLCWACRHLLQAGLGRPPWKTRGHSRRTRDFFPPCYPEPRTLPSSSYSCRPGAGGCRIPGAGAEASTLPGEGSDPGVLPPGSGSGLRYIKGPEPRARAMPSPHAPLGCAPGSGCPFPGLLPPLQFRFTDRCFPILLSGVASSWSRTPARRPSSPAAHPRRHRLSIAPPLRRDRTRGGKHPKNPSGRSTRARLPVPAAAPERPGPQRWHCQGPRGRWQGGRCGRTSLRQSGPGQAGPRTGSGSPPPPPAGTQAAGRPRRAAPKLSGHKEAATAPPPSPPPPPQPPAPSLRAARPLPRRRSPGGPGPGTPRSAGGSRCSGGDGGGGSNPAPRPTAPPSAAGSAEAAASHHRPASGHRQAPGPSPRDPPPRRAAAARSGTGGGGGGGGRWTGAAAGPCLAGRDGTGLGGGHGQATAAGGASSGEDEGISPRNPSASRETRGFVGRKGSPGGRSGARGSRAERPPRRAEGARGSAPVPGEAGKEEPGAAPLEEPWTSPKAEKVQVPGGGQRPPALGRDPGLPDISPGTSKNTAGLRLYPPTCQAPRDQGKKFGS